MIDNQKHSQFKVFTGTTFGTVAQSTEEYFNSNRDAHPKSMSIGLVNGRYFLTVGFLASIDQPGYSIRMRSIVIGLINLLYDSTSTLETILTGATSGREIICHDLFVENDILSLYTMEVVD